MLGQMMDRQLLISSIVRHADAQYPDSEVVSITFDHPRHRCTYAQVFARTRKLANALRKLGAKFGDRIGTLAWNDYRHLEIYYAVSGSGLVCHTINPRLFEEQIAYIVNHAEDRWLFIDPMFVPILEKIQDKLTTVEGFFVLIEADQMQKCTLRNVRSYEALLEPESDAFLWPEFEEKTASSLCYTSGTTGDPKGVLFSHRSTMLHCYASALPDTHNLSSREVPLIIVPMFHVNAWGLPYACVMVGEKLVLPGPKMGDAPTLQALIEEEGVTLSAAVPTVWQGLSAYLANTGKRIDSLKRLIVGGSAVPPALLREYRDKYGVRMVHAWGMTETSPMGTIGTLTPRAEVLPAAEREAVLLKQGRAVFGIEIKIVDEQGVDLPHDGKAFGALKVRGPWVVGSYYKRKEMDAFSADGWFSTGDVATIDPLGYMQITDRTKDVIKSGGEWISSIDLENLAVSHPAIAQAAVIAVSHPKWQERPLLVAVLKAGTTASREEILQYFLGKVAKWWIPDDVVFVDKLPLTATGKLSKLTLRQQFKEYRLPE